MRFDHGWDGPEKWRGRQLPRRGGLPFPAPEAGPEAPARLAQLLAASDLDAASLSDYHPGLLDEARRFAVDLGRPGVPSPRGAAAAALVVAAEISEGASSWTRSGGSRCTTRRRPARSWRCGRRRSPTTRSSRRSRSSAARCTG
ncbi:hypothetical protein [Catenuloplanes indicus]|uniref:Uncharacterized protein n=1 Tax=Catenuloplanes indicus TaxID=137267 RepID=A0AAE4AWD3_9ACTN|nr:hypothetical protein [Catenuloplanes indicus]MDQ0364877.1 hypothetical protein [Catenuloplanes indicus]